jgi:protein ImuB
MSKSVEGRTACVDLQALPLQLLLKRCPEWRDCPVAVVDQDRPQGTLLWVNERARAQRVLPGMRYSAALSLSGDLRAAVVSQDEISQGVGKLFGELSNFTPNVEAFKEEPGIFWLDASGLERLVESLLVWARQIRDRLTACGFEATVVVGFTRFGSYAAARAKRGVLLFGTLQEESAVARSVKLDRLDLQPKVRDALHKLGVENVGQFADLPTEGIARRFGEEILRWKRLADGSLDPPMQPQRPASPARERIILDDPESNALRLQQIVQQMLEPLLSQLADRCHKLAVLHLGFRFDRLGEHVEQIRAAAPTLDRRQWWELIQLRMEAVRKLPDSVCEITLLGEPARVEQKQSTLFDDRPRRDPAAANRALARVRAEWGESCVVHAQLREGHLPEGSFDWRRLAAIDKPQPHTVDAKRLGMLVRRIYSRPLPLPPRPRHEPDGWLLRGLEQGPVARVHGPYVVSGGWWNRKVKREYHFAETQKGEVLWVFYDCERRRWFLQGRVE